MAGSIPGPWIVDYLIDIAEEYGANLSATPRKEKAVKAQLIKFLTFPPPGRDEPCALWVEISDMKHTIRARLSVDAIRKYQQNPLHGGKSITSHKSALVSLKSFRPALGRVARRDDCHGLTEESTLFLDVDEIVFRGSFGEPMWGSPADAAASDPRIRDWIHGLRQDGGGGNVLKIRKQEANARAAERDEFEKQAALKPPPKPAVQSTINGAALDRKVRVARKSGAQKPARSLTAEDAVGRRVPTPVDKEVLRRATWKRFRAKMLLYYRPPDDVWEQLTSLSGHPLPKSIVHASTVNGKRRYCSRSGSRSRKPNSTHSSSSRSPSPKQPDRNSRAHTPQPSPQGTPTEWSPSVRGSPPPIADSDSDISETEERHDLDVAMEAGDADSDHENAMDADEPEPADTKAEHDEEPCDDDDIAAEHGSSFDLTMPPPEQPRPPPTPSDVPYATSQPPPLSQTPALSADQDLPPSSFPFPPSSFPFPPSSFPFPPSSFPHQPSSPLIKYQPSTPRRLGWSVSEPIMRRVPLPVCSTLQPDPDASGEGRVLVENSDTASPGSQRVGMSQSQSQSQSLQSQDQSQSQSQSLGRGGEEASQESQVQSQSQRPSKLRNELERARSLSRSADHEEEEEQGLELQGREGKLQEPQPVVGEDVPMAEAEAVADVADSQELQYPSQSNTGESPKSRQSLSYKGDSQSQEKDKAKDKSAEGPQGPPAPNAEPAVVAGAEEAAIHESEEAPASLEANLHLKPTDDAGEGKQHHPPPSPALSPMQVDDPPLPTAPTWAVIRASSSPEGGQSQEEEANVDELLSDPIEVDRDDKVAKVKWKGARNPKALDADDERTAAKVDRYLLSVQQREGVKEKDGMASTTTRRATPVKASPSVDEEPERRETKRRKYDGGGPSLPQDSNVFSRGESVKQLTAQAPTKGKQRERSTAPTREALPDSFPEDGTSASSQPAKHDPSVWAAPTFMRKPGKPKQDVVPPAAPAANAKDKSPSATGKSAGQKRPVSVSPEPEREEPPVKKRKTSTAAVPIPGPPVSSKSERQPVGRPAETARQSSVAGAKPPSVRPSQEAQKKRPQAQARLAPTVTSEAGSSAGNIKYVDLRAASRSSSRSSSRAGSRGLTAVQALRTPDERPPVAARKGKAPMRTVQNEKGTADSSLPEKIPALPVASAAKTVSSGNAAQASASSSMRPAHADFGSGGGTGAAASPAEEPGSDGPKEDPRPLLDGYKVSLDLAKLPNGPPVLNWQDMLLILQRTGCMRRKEGSGAKPKEEAT